MGNTHSEEEERRPKHRPRTHTDTHRHTDSMPQLPQLRDLSEERRTVWEGLRRQLEACYGKSGAARDAAEAAVEARMRAVRESDPDLFLAVDEDGDSLMHDAALYASGAGVVRCVWECCGERALQIMRHTTTPLGYTVLLHLAWNPAMTRGMYAVFAEHCTNHDLRAANNAGWTVLFRMAVIFLHRAKTEEQEENVASVMCAVVQRLGPGALLAETTKDSGFVGNDNKVHRYAAGSTPRSALHGAGDKGRALLQRLEEAAAHPEAAEAEETTEKAGGSAHATARSAAAPPPASASSAAAPVPSTAASEGARATSVVESNPVKDDTAASTTKGTASPKRDTSSDYPPHPTPSPAGPPPLAPPAATPHEVRARCALQIWIVTNTRIVGAAECYAAAMVGAGITDEASMQQRFDADASFLDTLIADAEDRAQIAQALATLPAPPTSSATATEAPAAQGDASRSAGTPTTSSTDNEDGDGDHDDDRDDDDDDIWSVDASDVDRARDEFNKIIMMRMDGNVQSMSAQMAVMMKHMRGMQDLVSGKDTAQTRRAPPLRSIPRGEIDPTTDLTSTAQLLGRGGSGVVFAGRFHGQNVAVKALRISAAQLQDESDRHVYRLRREGRILQAMRHPNVIRCMGACLDGEVLLVLERAELGSVRDLLRLPAAERPVVVDAVCKKGWLLDAMSALMYVHEVNVVHRDVKPANFLVMGDGRLKLADFGLARYADAAENTRDTTLPGEGAQGTWSYQAPELLRFHDKAPYSQFSDAFAFCISSWEICSERRWMSDAGSLQEVELRVCVNGERPPVDLSSVDPLLRPFLYVAQQGWHPVVGSRPTMAKAFRLVMIGTTPDTAVSGDGQSPLVGESKLSVNEESDEDDDDAELVAELRRWIRQHVRKIRKNNAQRYAEALVAANLTDIDRVRESVEDDPACLDDIIPDRFDRRDFVKALGGSRA